MALTLRPFEDGDLDRLFIWESDPRAVEMAAFTRPDPSDRGAFDGHYERVRSERSNVLLAIDDDSGEFVGTISSFTIDGEREVCYWISPAHWGRGLATEALRAFLALETTRPLRGRVADHNVASAKVLARNGFVEVGSETAFAPGVGAEVLERIYRLDGSGGMSLSAFEPDWSTKPTLTGARVELRPFREEDFVGIGEALADPEVLRLTGALHSPEEEALERQPVLDDRGLEWYRTRNETSDRLDLAIIERSTSFCVGEAVLNDFDPDNRSCNFRILIGPRGRDRGLGTEATQLIVAHGFQTLGLHRIELSVYAFNPRARHVYESVGFIQEGVRRDALRFGDRWIDEISMSILATDETAADPKG